MARCDGAPPLGDSMWDPLSWRMVGPDFIPILTNAAIAASFPMSHENLKNCLHQLHCNG